MNDQPGDETDDETGIDTDSAIEARHLVPGLALPKLSLRATNERDVDLSTLAGRVVVYCYSWTGRPGFNDPPNWDNIPGAHGSTPQTESFRDLHDRFAALDVMLFGLSLQASDYQREMVQRLRVPFQILSDSSEVFSTALNLPKFETGGANYLKRLTFVAKDGRIEKLFYPVSVPSNNAQDVVSWLCEL